MGREVDRLDTDKSCTRSYASSRWRWWCDCLRNHVHATAKEENDARTQWRKDSLWVPQRRVQMPEKPSLSAKDEHVTHMTIVYEPRALTQLGDGVHLLWSENGLVGVQTPLPRVTWWVRH